MGPSPWKPSPNSSHGVQQGHDDSEKHTHRECECVRIKDQKIFLEEVEERAGNTFHKNKSPLKKTNPDPGSAGHVL